MSGDALYRPMSASITHDNHVCLTWYIIDGNFLVIHWTELAPPPNTTYGTWRIKLADVVSCQAVDAGNAIVINDTIRIPFCQQASTEEECKNGRRGVAFLSDAMYAVFRREKELPAYFKKWGP